MDCSTPSFPVFHYLPEFAQIRVHLVGNATKHLIFCRPFPLPLFIAKDAVFHLE